MATITVKATQLGYYGMQRRKEGERFEIEEAAFSGKWMKKVKPALRDEDEDAPTVNVPPRRGGGRASDESKI
jgi:hypothetical protein